MSELKNPGSGLHVKLAPGQTLEIKGTDYVLKNNGQFTAQLQLYTKEYEEYMKKATSRRKVVEVGPQFTRSRAEPWKDGKDE
jgi:hypothetical protein